MRDLIESEIALEWREHALGEGYYECFPAEGLSVFLMFDRDEGHQGEWVASIAMPGIADIGTRQEARRFIVEYQVRCKVAEFLNAAMRAIESVEDRKED